MDSPTRRVGWIDRDPTRLPYLRVDPTHLSFVIVDEFDGGGFEVPKSGIFVE